TASVSPPALFGPSGHASETESYVPTYYPGTAESMLAIPVEVTLGSELLNVDFALSKTPTVRIRGRITNFTGANTSMVTIRLAPADESIGLNINRTFITNPQGEFELAGVVPGTYTFVASMFEGGTYTSVKKPLDA